MSTDIEMRVAALEMEVRLARTFTRAVVGVVASKGALTAEDLKSFRYLFVIEGDDPVATGYLKWLETLINDTKPQKNSSIPPPERWR